MSRRPLLSKSTDIKQSLALYNRHTPCAYEFVFNPRVDSLCGLSQTLYLLGYPDQALQRAQEALAPARELAHPFSLAETLMQSARQGLLTLRQRPAVVRREEEKVLGQEEDLG